MAKRVSLKGKGADIFFGDYAPSSDPAEPEEILAAPAAAADGPTAAEQQPDTDGKQAGKPQRKKARMLASKSASSQASKQADSTGRHDLGSQVQAANPHEVGAIFTEAVWASVDTPATITNSFRYTDGELTALTDVLYEISKQYRAKLTKQDVARLGLNVILDDFRQRGADSLLGQLAARRRRKR